MFLLALLVYVAAEIAAFVVVAERLGILIAVLLVLAIDAAGPLLVRRAGLGVLAHARARLARGESPTPDLLDGVVLLLGGAFVCVPGFIGDVIGLSLLVGPVRHLVIRWSGRALARRLQRSSVWRAGGRRPRPGRVIDLRGADHRPDGHREIPGESAPHGKQPGDRVDLTCRRRDPGDVAGRR